MGALPTYINKGAFQAGTGALTVPVPTGYQDGDTLVLLVVTANQAIAAISGWTEVTNSPQYTGAASTAGGVRLAVFWKNVSGAQSSVAVADAGTFTSAQMYLFRGTDPTTRINATAGSVLASAGTTWTCPGVTTTTPNCLILHCIGQDKDASASMSYLSNPVNNNLTNKFVRGDDTSNAGTGGGVGLIVGGKNDAGATGDTTVTSANSTTAVFITVALASTPPVTLSADITESKATSHASVANVPLSADRTENPTVADTTFAPNVGYMVEEVAVADKVKWDLAPEMIGTPHTSSTAGTTYTETITVPAGTTLALVYFAARTSNPYPTSANTSCSLGGVDGVSVGQTWANPGGCTVVKAIINPPSGDQTFTWTSGAYVAIVICSFYKNTSGNPILGFRYGQYNLSYACSTIPTSPFGLSVGWIYVPLSTTPVNLGFSQDGAIERVFVDRAAATWLSAKMCDKVPNRGTVYSNYYETNSQIVAVGLEGLSIFGNEYDVTGTSGGSVTGHTQEGVTQDYASAETAIPHHASGPFATIIANPTKIEPTTYVVSNYAITVPEGTDAILAFYVSGRSGRCTPAHYSVNLGGTPFTHLVSSGAWVGLGIFVGPTPGPQMFGWNVTDDYVDDATIFLVYVSGLVIDTDPVISSGYHITEDGLWGSTITGLTYETGCDICIGMSRAEYGLLQPFPIGTCPLTPGIGQITAGPTHHAYVNDVEVMANWETTTFQSGSTNATRYSDSVAVVLRGYTGGMITLITNERDITESAIATEEEHLLFSYDDSRNESAGKLWDLNGPYVDIPEKLLTSIYYGSRPYQDHTYIDTPTNSGLFTDIHQDTNLMIVVYTTIFDTAGWIQNNQYDLSLDGRNFTHLLSTSVGGHNVMVAYLKDPTPGTFVFNFDNPYFAAEYEEYDYSDMMQVFQFTGVDVSGDPFRDVIAPSRTYGTSKTVTGYTQQHGDMVLGIVYGYTGSYGGVEFDRALYKIIEAGGVFHSIYGWGLRCEAVGVLDGATSITAISDDGSADINMLVLVLKNEQNRGWIGTMGERADSLALVGNQLASYSAYSSPDLSALVVNVDQGGISIATGARSDSMAVAGEQTAVFFLSALWPDTLALSTETSALQEAYASAADSLGDGESTDGERIPFESPAKVCEEFVAVEDIYTGQYLGLAQVDESAISTEDLAAMVQTIADQVVAAAIEASASGLQTANAAQQEASAGSEAIDAILWMLAGQQETSAITEALTGLGFALALHADVLLPEDLQDAIGATLSIVADSLAIEDVATSYGVAGAIAAEFLVAWEEAGALAVSWAFSVDETLTFEASTAIADMWASSLEISGVVEGYSALVVELYIFPAMTVSYNPEVYTATLEIPAVTAMLIKEEFTATHTAAQVTASFTGQKIVASYAPTILIATKGE